MILQRLYLYSVKCWSHFSNKTFGISGVHLLSFSGFSPFSSGDWRNSASRACNICNSSPPSDNNTFQRRNNSEATFPPWKPCSCTWQKLKEKKRGKDLGNRHFLNSLFGALSNCLQQASRGHWAWESMFRGKAGPWPRLFSMGILKQLERCLWLWCKRWCLQAPPTSLGAKPQRLAEEQVLPEVALEMHVPMDLSLPSDERWSPATPIFHTTPEPQAGVLHWSQATGKIAVSHHHLQLLDKSPETWTPTTVSRASSPRRKVQQTKRPNDVTNARRPGLPRLWPILELRR